MTEKQGLNSRRAATQAELETVDIKLANLKNERIRLLAKIEIIDEMLDDCDSDDSLSRANEQSEGSTKKKVRLYRIPKVHYVGFRERIVEILQEVKEPLTAVQIASFFTPQDLKTFGCRVGKEHVLHTRIRHAIKAHLKGVVYEKERIARKPNFRPAIVYALQG